MDRPTGRVELHVKCRLARFHANREMCVALFVQQPSSMEWTETGRTENIKQPLRFCVFQDTQLVGEVTCDLATIVGARRQQISRDVANFGSFIISAEELNVHPAAHEAPMKQQVTIHFCGSDLDKKDLFGKSDPFYDLSRAREGGEPVPVYQSEVVKSTLNPRWQPCTLLLEKLCNNDIDRPLTFECFDWNKHSERKPIGSFQFSVRALREGTREFRLINKAKQHKKSHYTHSGIERVESFSETAVPAIGHGDRSGVVVGVEEPEFWSESGGPNGYRIYHNPYSFMEYIAGGCSVGMVVAIDFTVSNGDPTSPNSLHTIDPKSPLVVDGRNPYLQAITAVGEILCHYDSDGEFTVFGFGGRPHRGDAVSQCFSLGERCRGLEGIVEAYYRALQTAELAAPTTFAEVIDAAAAISARGGPSQTNQSFPVLLILTDGCITKGYVEPTIASIVKASRLPLSIIIVGIGNEDFSEMRVLDADDAPLAAGGVTAERDIVQFVSLRDYGTGASLDRARLACSAAIDGGPFGHAGTDVVRTVLSPRWDLSSRWSLSPFRGLSAWTTLFAPCSLSPAYSGLSADRGWAPKEPIPLSPPQYQTELAQLKDMGFHDEARCMAALRAANGNVQQALERLLGNAL